MPQPQTSALPTAPSDIDFNVSNFWSDVPHSARWVVALRSGETRACASQVRTVFRAIKSAIGRPTLDLSWTAADSTALYDRLQRANVGALVSLPLTRTQTRWTPEMLAIALWYAYARTIADATGVSVPARTTLPVSGQNPPQDGSASTDEAAACWFVPTVDAVAPPPAPPAVTPLARLDWNTGNFWSGDLHSARWIVRASGQQRYCASQARSLLRYVKAHCTVVGAVSPGDSGKWTQPSTELLMRWYLERGYDEASLPFTRGQTTWTPDLLRAVLAVASNAAPNQIILPSQLTLPRSDVVPPTDGFNDSIVAPDCTVMGPIPAIAPVPGPVTPGAVSTTPVLYGAASCSVCAQARSYLDTRRVAYRYVDVLDTAMQPSWQEVQARARASGQQAGAVPVLDVGGSNLVVGFDMAQYDRVLGIASEPSGPLGIDRMWWYAAGAVAAAGLAWWLFREPTST